MANVFLLTAENDPVGNAVDALFSKLSEGQSTVHRISIAELGDIDISPDDVLLLGDDPGGVVEVNKLPQNGLIQYLGCRPGASLLELTATSDAVIAGISPIIAPRVANRVIGFTGPLPAKVKPSWGVVGLGEVGCEVVTKITANRAPVVVADMRTPRAGVLADLGVRRQTLDLLVSGSDVISLHIHAGPTAAPLISERELRLMSPEAVLINTSHDSVVDEGDVVTALEQGVIAGYATDCPGEVILGANPELISSNILIITTNPLTNQVGAAQQIAKFVAENAEAFLTGAKVRGRYEVIDFPTAGDPSFWSSRMSPRQD
jgi:hypothetical protein